MPANALLLKAYRLMYTAMTMAGTYEAQRRRCPYVHSTSRGHEAIQVAAGLQLKPWDYASPYYRDDAMLLAMGFRPYELMLQLLARKDDPFTGGRSYYSHPCSTAPDKPQIPQQSSATGMQAIPATGMAQGIQYLEKIQALPRRAAEGEPPLVLCSLGDGSLTEGEVSEAFQFAALHRLPVLYLVQDNDWGISVRGEEARVADAYDFAAGFPGIQRLRVDGSLFEEAWHGLRSAMQYVREQRAPMLLHATVPLLGHHTSGVRKETYRPPEDLARHALHDPLPRLRQRLLGEGAGEAELEALEASCRTLVEQDFEKAWQAAEPDPATVATHVFAPSPVQAEEGCRRPAQGETVRMVDAALHAVAEILREHPEAIFFGQDVGRRLGGVFREAATLAERFGTDRVFNTAIQEAYVVGATAGLSAVGVKPIVEVQFADYLYPGLNQLVCEVAKSGYLSCGRFPVQMVLRVPTGAYGGGGPYHSGSIESTLLSIKGIKVVYPSNAADMKGLMKAAWRDPNPVVMLEHKGLYWGKVPGTQAAATVEPDEAYCLPLGRACRVLEADPAACARGLSLCVVSYGMGVHWALNAARHFPGRIALVDLRCLEPLDEDLVYSEVMRHGKCLVLTEEPLRHSFAEALAARIMQHCFARLDAPVATLGALNLPAVPLHTGLEAAMLPSAEKTRDAIAALLRY